MFDLSYRRKKLLDMLYIDPRGVREGIALIFVEKVLLRNTLTTTNIIIIKISTSSPVFGNLSFHSHGKSTPPLLTTKKIKDEKLVGSFSIALVPWLNVSHIRNLYSSLLISHQSDATFALKIFCCCFLIGFVYLSLLSLTVNDWLARHQLSTDINNNHRQQWEQDQAGCRHLKLQ